MQKRIMMWYANINHHKHIISLSYLLTQEVKLPLPLRRDGREVKKMPHPSFFADVASIILEVIKVIKSVYLMITFLSSFDVLCCPIHYKP